MHAYVVIYHQDSFYQSRTACLHWLHHQCSYLFHFSHLICFLLQDNLIKCMLEYSIVLFLSSNFLLSCRILPTVFSRPAFSMLSTKVSQDLTLIRRRSRAMDETGFQFLLKWSTYRFQRLQALSSAAGWVLDKAYFTLLLLLWPSWLAYAWVGFYKNILLHLCKYILRFKYAQT